MLMRILIALAGLAALLGCTPDVLTQLRLCRRPGAAEPGRTAEEDMATKTWAMGEHFSMADCAAAPALFYANLVLPFGDTHPNAAGYLGRLLQRPSYARAVKEAQPYFGLFPK